MTITFFKSLRFKKGFDWYVKVLPCMCLMITKQIYYNIYKLSIHCLKIFLFLFVLLSFPQKYLCCGSKTSSLNYS